METPEQKRFNTISGLRKGLSALDFKFCDFFDDENDPIFKAWANLLNAVDTERQRLRKIPGVK